MSSEIGAWEGTKSGQLFLGLLPAFAQQRKAHGLDSSWILLKSKQQANKQKLALAGEPE